MQTGTGKGAGTRSASLIGSVGDTYDNALAKTINALKAAATDPSPPHQKDPQLFSTPKNHSSLGEALLYADIRGQF